MDKWIWILEDYILTEKIIEKNVIRSWTTEGNKYKSK